MVIIDDALHPKPFWREGCVTAAAVATWPRVASKALWGRPVDERHTVGLKKKNFQYYSVVLVSVFCLATTYHFTSLSS